jgi:hypothetical protein
VGVKERVFEPTEKPIALTALTATQYVWLAVKPVSEIEVLVLPVLTQGAPSI